MITATLPESRLDVVLSEIEQRLYSLLKDTAPESGKPVADLAETVEMDRSNVNRHLNNLRAYGLVSRQQIHLSPGGCEFRYYQDAVRDPTHDTRVQISLEDASPFLPCASRTGMFARIYDILPENGPEHAFDYDAGVSSKEIAERIQMDKSSVNRYLREMGSIGLTSDVKVLPPTGNYSFKYSRIDDGLDETIVRKWIAAHTDRRKDL